MSRATLQQIREWKRECEQNRRQLAGARTRLGKDPTNITRQRRVAALEAAQRDYIEQLRGSWKTS